MQGERISDVEPKKRGKLRIRKDMTVHAKDKGGDKRKKPTRTQTDSVKGASKKKRIRIWRGGD